MSACETCWAEASRRAAYSGGHVADIYREVLRQNDGWPPNDAACGGVSIGGAEPKCCEVHMLPWGHKQKHPHDA